MNPGALVTSRYWLHPTVPFLPGNVSCSWRAKPLTEDRGYIAGLTRIPIKKYRLMLNEKKKCAPQELHIDHQVKLTLAYIKSMRFYPVTDLSFQLPLLP